MISFIFFLTGRGGGQKSGLAVQFGEEGAALLDEDFGRFGEQDVGRQRSRRLDVNCVEKNQNDKKKQPRRFHDQNFQFNSIENTFGLEYY